MPFELGSFSLGALGGGVVVGLLNHLLSKSRDKESRQAKDFNKAAEVLAEILTKEKRCRRSWQTQTFSPLGGFLPVEKHPSLISALRSIKK